MRILPIIVCDDLNNEFADFIGIDEKKKRITVVRAKAGEKQLSASAFQEVCGQAVKNLDIMSPFYEQDSSNKVTKWNGGWNDGKIGKVDKRIICGGKDGKQIWKIYSRLLTDPDTEKEVIIITGCLFEKAELQ